MNDVDRAGTADPLKTTAAGEAEPRDVGRELDKIRDELKEREFSFLRALKTLIDDLLAYHQGKGPFPKAALIGVVFSYLRPRLIVIVGSVVGSLMIVLQAYLLWTQNKLISQQNALVQLQTEANQMATLSSLLSTLDPRDTLATEVAIAQLASYGDPAFSVLMRLAQSSTVAGTMALQSLLGQSAVHSPPQVDLVLNVLQQEALKFEIVTRISLIPVHNRSDVFADSVAAANAAIARSTSLSNVLNRFALVLTEAGDYLSRLGRRASKDAAFATALRKVLPSGPTAALTLLQAESRLWDYRVIPERYDGYGSWLSGVSDFCEGVFGRKSGPAQNVTLVDLMDTLPVLADSITVQLRAADFSAWCGSADVSDLSTVMRVRLVP